MYLPHKYGFKDKTYAIKNSVSTVRFRSKKTDKIILRAWRKLQVFQRHVECTVGGRKTGQFLAGFDWENEIGWAISVGGVF